MFKFYFNKDRDLDIIHYCITYNEYTINEKQNN